MIFNRYNVDGVLTPLNEVLILAGQGKLHVVGTSTHNVAGDTIIMSHFTTNHVGGGPMTSFYGPKSVEYKQRFNKKVAMA